MQSISSSLFLLFASPSALRHQLLDWPNRTSKPVRFALFCAFSALVLAFAEPFRQLPNGWFNIVLANLFTVPGAFVAFMLSAIFIISCGMVLLAHKVSCTL
jgi:hypothetical protein